MEFEWDEGKSQACFEERGFDFAYAATVFFDPDRLIELDERRSYGEDRHHRGQGLCSGFRASILIDGIAILSA